MEVEGGRAVGREAVSAEGETVKAVVLLTVCCKQEPGSLRRPSRRAVEQASE